MAALLRWLGITIDPVMDFGEELAFRDFQWVLRRSSSRQPAKKPWRFITSSFRLAKNLAILKCTQSTHAPLQGKWTRPAFYPEPLCNLMIQSLFPHVVNQHMYSMPCAAKSHQPHRQKLVPGYPSVPLDIKMFNVGCQEVVAPTYVHRLLGRSEWKDRPEVLDAINSEKQGLLANGTWDESKIRPKAEVLAEARAKRVRKFMLVP